MGHEMFVRRPLESEGVHIVGSEVQSHAAVHACDFAPTSERQRDAASWIGNGTSVAMSYGAVSLDDEYVSSLPSPGSSEAGQESPDDMLRICVVGSGTRFISGISYYTYYLSDALQETFNVSAVLMRRLLPRRFYPGRRRVGAHITDIETSTIVPTFDGVDWFAVPSLFRAGRFLRQQQPDVVVFQWWTGTVLHSFLYLLRVAQRSGASVVVEFHEDQDSGETRMPLVERIVRPGLRHLIRSADHYVVHSEWDKDRLGAKFSLDPARVTVIPHGPYPIEKTAQSLETHEADVTSDTVEARWGRGSHHSLLRDDSSLQGSGRPRRGFQPPAPQWDDTLAPSCRRGDMGGMGTSRREDPDEWLRRRHRIRQPLCDRFGAAGTL